MLENAKREIPIILASKIYTQPRIPKGITEYLNACILNDQDMI